MLVLGVPNNFDFFVSDEEVGKKTAATTRTTEFSETWPRYNTAHTLHSQWKLTVSKLYLWEILVAIYSLFYSFTLSKF